MVATAEATTFSVASDTALARANDQALAGDLVVISPGTYSEPIYPTHNGTSGARISYVGSMSNPDGASVANIVLGTDNAGLVRDQGDYVTVKWVHSQLDVRQNYFLKTGTGVYYACHYDSVVSCTFANQLTIHGKASAFDSLKTSGTVSEGRLWMNDDDGTATVRPSSNAITHCAFNWSHSSGDFQGAYLRHCQYNTFFRDTFVVASSATSNAFFPLELYFSYYNLFQQCTWQVTMNSTPNTTGLWGYRDSSSYNRWLQCNAVCSGSGQLSLTMSQSGTPGLSESTNHTYLGWNLIKIGNPTTSKAGLDWQNGARTDTLEFNVVAANGRCVATGANAFTSTIFRHNTLYSTSNPVVDVSSATSSSGTRFVANVFYCTGANSSGSPTVATQSGVELDSSGTYFSVGGTASYGIKFGGSPGTPGTGSGYGASGKAVWGSPQLTDSSYASLNTVPLSTGYAVGGSLQDDFSGVYPEAPGTISDLQKHYGHSTVVLTWTAPAAHENTSATRYDVRFASTAITTEAIWDTATTLAGPPTPSTPGDGECFDVSSAMACLGSYYFAVKSYDEFDHPSALSNSPGAQWTCPGHTEYDCGNLLTSGGGGEEELVATFLRAQPIAKGAAILEYSAALQRGPVRLEVFDLAGRLVRTLKQSDGASGAHVTVWDLRDNRGLTVRQGVYLVRMRVEQEQLVARVMVVR